MRHNFVLFTLVMASLVTSASQSQQAGQRSDNTLSVARLEAAVIALTQFRKEQPNADKDNMFVTVSETAAEFAVTFRPRANPMKTGTEGNSNYIEFDNPRGNQYGDYVEYRVSKKLHRVVRSGGAK